MAAFDYDCTHCGVTRELQFAMGQAPAQFPLTCPKCGLLTPHRRRWAATAVQFKGPGFYTTDSRDEIDQWTFRNLDKD